MVRSLSAAGCLVASLASADRAAFAHGGDDTPTSREDANPATSVPIVPGSPAGGAAPQTADQGPTPATTAPAASDEDKKKSPWHGSVLLFDQSVTTQTVGIGADYQSADPVYEWWFAFKPRYYLYESKVES